MANRTLALRIKALRMGAKPKLTQEGLGRMMKPPKSRGMVGHWECGRADPNSEDLRMLAKVFETSTDYLLGLSNERSNAA